MKVKHAGMDLPPAFRVGRKPKRSVPTRSVEDERGATAEFGTDDLLVAALVAELTKHYMYARSFSRPINN